MDSLRCTTCGGTEMVLENGYYVCQYCGNKYEAKNITNTAVKDSVIDIKSDVEILLEKCRKNPALARKYANLVLDIDPNNKEAWNYLR